MKILEQPLVAYAGMVTENKGSMTFYGHEKYIPGWVPSIEASYKYLDAFDQGKLYLISGNLDNPNFHWPMYAIKD